MNNIDELKQIALNYISLYEQVEDYLLKDNYDCVYSPKEELLKLHKKCENAREKVKKISTPKGPLDSLSISK